VFVEDDPVALSLLQRIRIEHAIGFRRDGPAHTEAAEVFDDGDLVRDLAGGFGGFEFYFVDEVAVGGSAVAFLDAGDFDECGGFAGGDGGGNVGGLGAGGGVGGLLAVPGRGGCEK